MMLLVSYKGMSQNTGNTDVMETIIPAGNNATGASGTVTYSIGQVFYTYIGSEAVYNVAQGVQHQETDENLGTPEIPVIKTEIFVFPNPTSDFVNVNMEGYELENGQRSYKIYDIQGKLLKQNKIEDAETQISLSNFRTSIYILLVYVDNKVVETFKIIKK